MTKESGLRPAESRGHRSEGKGDPEGNMKTEQGGMVQKNGREKTGAVAQLECAGLASPMPHRRAGRWQVFYLFHGSFICILYIRDLESSRRHKITNNANTIVITEKPRAL